MHTLRAPLIGVLLPVPTDDALGALSRFDEPDGSFGFRLLPVLKNFSYGAVQPGESLEYGYDYFATASTGFGETDVFAAIGDPFDLSMGGRFDFRVNEISAAPEPATLGLIALALAAMCTVLRGACSGKMRIGR